jgi:hypothetical protein
MTCTFFNPIHQLESHFVILVFLPQIKVIDSLVKPMEHQAPEGLNPLFQSCINLSRLLLPVKIFASTQDKILTQLKMQGHKTETCTHTWSSNFIEIDAVIRSNHLHSQTQKRHSNMNSTYFEHLFFFFLFSTVSQTCTQWVWNATIPSTLLFCREESIFDLKLISKF